MSTDTPRKTIKKARTKKAPKDKNAPKKPQTAYFLFMADIRKKTVEENPQAKNKIADLGRIMGKKWKALTPEQKQPYLEKAAELKVAYQKKKSVYDQSDEKKAYDVEKEAFKQKNAKKFRNDTGAPKKPQTAYFIFMGEIRSQTKQENPDASFATLGKLMGKKWKSLTDEERQPYKDKADIARKEYNLRKAEYDKSEEKQQYDMEKREWQLAQDRAKATVANRGKKRKSHPKIQQEIEIIESSEEDDSIEEESVEESEEDDDSGEYSDEDQ